MSVQNNKFKRKLYITDYSFTPSQKISNAAILCEDNKISALGNLSSFDLDSEIEILDMKGTYAIPGFIDSHIHGAGGFDSSTAGETTEDFSLMSRTLGSHGVTSFLPTIVSRPQKRLLNAISALVNLLDKEHSGAAPVGIRVEGPYINKIKCGSQDIDYIRPIDLGELKEIIAEGKGKIKIMTFAPELDKSLNLIEILLEHNIIPSMGHSMADEETVIRAINAGARHCTHLFNGMPVLHHRSVGIAGVVLTDDRVSTEIIVDGYHVHPRMIDLACRSKPKDKIIGISDAIQGAGLDDGIYHIDNVKVKVKDGRAVTDDGTIAGTTLTLERGWTHLIKHSHLNLMDAAACLTTNPAKLLNLESKGLLHPGWDADIAFFSTETNKAVMTVRNGQTVYLDKNFNSDKKQPVYYQ